MKKTRSLLTILLLLFVGSWSAMAQKEDRGEKRFILRGSIDTYFRSNLNAPNDKGNDSPTPNTSFANLPGFSLGMVNVITGYEGERVGVVADLVFGPRGEDAVFNSPQGSAQIINQLYAYLNLNKSIKFTIGNFNTFLGYEVISPTGNFNYSTSYLFSYGPFSHIGIKADFTLSERISLMLAVMNPTDYTEFNPNGEYVFGAQLGYASQYLNLIYGDGSYEIDFTGGVSILGGLYLGVNVAYFDDDGVGFGGLALYPQYTLMESLTIGLRAEYFKEHGKYGAIGTGVEDSSVFATTLTVNYKAGSLTITPEIRIDDGSEGFFLDSNSNKQKSLSSFLLAAVYSF